MDKEIKDLFLMQQIQATLYTLYNKIQSESDKHFGDITSKQYMALMAVTHLPKNKASINNVARKLGTSKQNAKQLLTPLNRKGYIEFQKSFLDKRSVNIRLTRQGREMLLAASGSGILFLEEQFHDFSTQELERLWEQLKKLYRFDGNEMSGFEDESDETTEQYALSDEEEAMKLKALREFSLKRKNRRKETIK